MEKEFNKEESTQNFQKDTTATGQTTEGAFVDTNIQEEYMEHLRKNQNIGMAIVGGLAASFVGAILWTVVTVSTGWQIGFMAIGVGILVGFAVRFLGKGVDIPFGIVGAVFALLGCVLGNFLAVYGLTAQAFNVGYFEIFGLVEVGAVIDQFIANMGPIDLLFYGFALYEGFKFSTISPTNEDLLEYAATK